MRDLPTPLVGPLPGRCAHFEWRGLLVDSARTCFSLSTLQKLVQLLATYGFNRLHWHITDDQGWRFNVPDYPRLVEVSAQLARSTFADYDCIAPGSLEAAAAEADSRWRNGFYTDAQINELVQYAASYGITVVPELDLPGHMAAAIKAYPEFGKPSDLPLPSGSMRENTDWAARNDLLWPNAQTQHFLRAALQRVVELFPGEYVHIGGDECAWKQWEADAEINTWMQTMGLENHQAIQRWFMQDAVAFLRAHGKQVVTWDDACGWVDDETLVMAWDEERGMQRIAKSQQNYVFADARTLYINRIDPNTPRQKGMVPGIRVSDILTADWEETVSSRCVGVQACLWSEMVLDEEDMFSMLMPRLLAVAERLWNPLYAPGSFVPSVGFDAQKVAEIHAAITAEYQHWMRVYQQK